MLGYGIKLTENDFIAGQQVDIAKENGKRNGIHGKQCRIHSRNGKHIAKTLCPADPQNIFLPHRVGFTVKQEKHKTDNGY